MKTRYFIFALLASFPSFGQAQEPSLSEIIEKRGIVLEQIVAAVEKSVQSGTGDTNEIYQARISLLTFRREAAPDAKTKIEWQHKIIDLEKQTKIEAEKGAASGLANPVIALRAEERVLAARQKLLELESSAGG
ncbi:MAG: hypothetical protein ABI680_05250 [Chthoniobacteraceae bacterium]